MCVSAAAPSNANICSPSRNPTRLGKSRSPQSTWASVSVCWSYERWIVPLSAYCPYQFTSIHIILPLNKRENGDPSRPHLFGLWDKDANGGWSWSMCALLRAGPCSHGHPGPSNWNSNSVTRHLQHLEHLGLCLNRVKSRLQASQSIEFLGMCFDASAGILSLKTGRPQRLLVAVQFQISSELKFWTCTQWSTASWALDFAHRGICKPKCWWHTGAKVHGCVHSL